MDPWFDPQRALDQLKKLAAAAPAQIADGVGRLVLEAKAAANVKTAIRWNITGRADEGVDTYLLEVDNGTARTNRGTEGPAPKLTITMDGVEFLRLVSGNSDPMAAYFKGRIQLAGDIMVAAQLAQMFKMPGGGAEQSGDDGPSNANGGGELEDPSH